MLAGGQPATIIQAATFAPRFHCDRLRDGLMATSSSEFQLPAGETKPEGVPTGDSTIDAPMRPLPPGAKPGQLKSTIAGASRTESKPQEPGKTFGDFRIKGAIGRSL